MTPAQFDHEFNIAIDKAIQLCQCPFWLDDDHRHTFITALAVRILKASNPTT
jgi:hypothetical protein